MIISHVSDNKFVWVQTAYIFFLRMHVDFDVSQKINLSSEYFVTNSKLQLSYMTNLLMK